MEKKKPHKAGLWEKVVALCDLHLARSVMDEAHFYEDDSGDRHDFDLTTSEKDGTISVFDVPASEVQALCNQFDPTYLERLDPGEAESLAYLMKASDEVLICSADSIVFLVLGNIDKSEQGVSLEEVLKRLGLGRSLRWPFLALAFSVVGLIGA